MEVLLLIGACWSLLGTSNSSHHHPSPTDDVYLLFRDDQLRTSDEGDRRSEETIGTTTPEAKGEGSDDDWLKGRWVDVVVSSAATNFNTTTPKAKGERADVTDDQWGK